MKRYLEKVLYCTAQELDDMDVSAEGKKDAGKDIDENVDENINRNVEGILYVTDEEVCLRTLKARRLPVAAWLHEGNRAQNLSAAFYALESPKELDMDFFEKIYRREKGIPWDILETERCLVREMVPEDAKTFAEIYRESAVSRYMKDFHTDEQGEAEYIRAYQQQYCFFEYGVWCIVLKETGEVIGRAGFSQAPEEYGEDVQDEVQSEQRFDFCMKDIPQLGYVIGVPWQRQGLAYEVCSAILKYAKEELGFEAVQLRVEEGNAASLRLAEKLGFSEVEEQQGARIRIMRLCFK